MSRRGITLACVLAFAAIAGAFACGIDESGLEQDSAAGDGALPDVVSDVVPPIDVNNDVPLPPSCATLDVSCLGLDAGVPDGWSAFVVEAEGGACPPGDFAGTPWQINARLATGACACSCSTSGTWSCPSTIDLLNGGACTTGFTVEAGVCTIPPFSSHVEMAKTVFASGNVTCGADASAPAADTDSVTLCAAGCEAGADFCGAVGRRCIAADGVQPCPGALVQHFVGSGATASCGSCACQPIAVPACNATAHVYNGYFQNGYHQNDGCFDGGQWNEQTIAVDNTCKSANQNYESIDVEWNALAAPTCNASGGGGDAGLASVKTVCCNN